MKDDLEFIYIDLDNDNVYGSTVPASSATNAAKAGKPVKAGIADNEAPVNTSDDIAYFDDQDTDDPDYSDEIDSPYDSEENTKKKLNSTIILKEIASYVLVILAAFILASLTNRYLIVNARIPTGSMIPTIMEGDRIIGNRIAYVNSEPKRGDIIVFYYPDNESEKYVKRIIGLPGETVYINDGIVYIDNQPLDESDYLSITTIGTSGPFIVPEDSYFVMGDNRNSSWDSRFWHNTYVHKDKIIAKAEFCYYPKLHWVR